MASDPDSFENVHEQHSELEAERAREDAAKAADLEAAAEFVATNLTPAARARLRGALKIWPSAVLSAALDRVPEAPEAPSRCGACGLEADRCPKCDP